MFCAFSESYSGSLQRLWTGEPFLLSELLVTRTIVLKKEYVGLALPPSECLHRSVIRADRHRAVFVSLVLTD